MLRLADVFTNHMVLQRGTSIAVWGEGENGHEICVSLGDKVSYTICENDKWKVYLPPFKAGGPYEMKVISGNKTLTFNDIYTGEVWIAGGQSNMEYKLNADRTAREEIPVADWPLIRFYNTPHVPYVEGPEKEPEKYGYKSSWKIVTSENAGYMSAVAYYFAKDLQKALGGIAIGILDCNWGGSSAANWTSEEYLAKDPGTNTYLEEFKAFKENLDMDDLTKKVKEYDEKLRAYSKKYDEAIKKDLKGDEIGKYVGNYPWPNPMAPLREFSPSMLYKTMVKKIAPYTSKGVIFYQGESDAHKPEIYRQLFTYMTENWRRDFENPSLYFHTVQLASWISDGKDKEGWTGIRYSQYWISRHLANSGMVLAIDWGDLDDIHPKDKKPLGQRLALTARALTYGEEIEYSGPEAYSAQKSGDTIIVNFRHTTGGLVLKNGSEGFYICGKDRFFYKANAKIQGDRLFIRSDSVPNPVSARYAWKNFPEISLYNGEDLPAIPFDTALL